MRQVLLVVALASDGSAFAQQHQQQQVQPQSGYAGLQDRDIKALSQEQVADLQEGRGMGASLPAELSGVPGPLHVLQLKGKLNVTTEQQASLERISAEMKASAQQLGQQVIAAEAALDRAFKTGGADQESIPETTARIGAVQGQLRSVHLIAHLQTKQLLSGAQVVAYNEARGYSRTAAEPSHPH